jgi:hypothetical protein
MKPGWSLRIDDGMHGWRHDDHHSNQAQCRQQIPSWPVTRLPCHDESDSHAKHVQSSKLDGVNDPALSG